MKRSRSSSGKDEVGAELAGYAAHAHEIGVCMGRYHLHHLNRVHREFDGDIVTAIILGEVAHHNICRYFSSGIPTPAAEGMDWASESSHRALEPCTAFSLSAATGIPRETIRRKASALVRRGWLRRHPEGGYVIRPAVAPHFHAHFNVVSLNELLRTADELRDILEGRRSVDASRSPKPAGRHARTARGPS